MKFLLHHDNAHVYVIQPHLDIDEEGEQMQICLCFFCDVAQQMHVHGAKLTESMEKIPLSVSIHSFHFTTRLLLCSSFKERVSNVNVQSA